MAAIRDKENSVVREPSVVTGDGTLATAAETARAAAYTPDASAQTSFPVPSSATEFAQLAEARAFFEPYD